MKNSIEIRSVTCLKGPNMWTYRPVLEARVDIGALEDSPSNTLPGFCDRLVAWLPSLNEHRCSYGEPGGFVKRLQEGTWPGHILEHVTLELQNLAGMPGGFGRARETSVRGVYKVVVRSWHEVVTKQALYDARDLVMAAIENQPFDVASHVHGLRHMIDELCLGPSTAAIVHAAEKRRIPFIRLSDGNLVQLGHGANQHRIWTAETDLTSAISQGIARDKDLTRGLLKSCGVPVPDGRLVESAEDARSALADSGGSITIKPNDAGHGRTVLLDLRSDSEVDQAYAIARQESRYILAEDFVAGDEHRLLVIGGKLVAAARGHAAEVVGDGRSTVRELIEAQLNSDPYRGDLSSCPLNRIELDEVVRFELGRQNSGPDAIPAAGERLCIRRDGNVDTDVTDKVHPTVAAAARLAVRTVGLDIAGVDVVAKDISAPIADSGTAVVAVHAGPGLLLHLKPKHGAPRPVGDAVIEHLFPNDSAGRIPIVGICGTQDSTIVAHLTARLLELNGLRVGLACRDGLFFDRRIAERGDRANWESANRILLNRGMQAAVCENGPLTLVGEGLAYDRCQVGVVTGIDPAATIAEFDIQTAEQMYNVVRTQVDVVLPGGAAVLNAHDPLLAPMAELCDGDVIFYGSDPNLESLRAHRAAGKRSVTIRNNRVVLAVGDSYTDLAALSRLTPRNGRKGLFGTPEILAAVAVGWSLGIPPAIIRAGIETYRPVSKEQR